MRLKRKKIRKKTLIFFVIILILVLSIFIGKKIYQIYQTNKANQIVQEKINSIFVFEDLNLDYTNIIKKYGTGTDNKNSNDKIFCTTFDSNFDKYNVVKIFYYNDLMKVEKIDIYNYENSKYEVLNYITSYLGDCKEYNNEIKELATEYKWEYDIYDIILIDNIDSNSIILKTK